MKLRSLLFVIATAGLIFISCKKNGTGGESEISVYVKHHSKLIPGAAVYIKYGAKEFPGADPSAYDNSKTAGSAGHSEGHTHFSGLLKGDYYLYAVGYDSTAAKTVTGGMHVKIEKKGDHKDADIAVGE